MFRFIESIRWEFGKYHLLEYHAARMERTLQSIFNISKKIDLHTLLPKPPLPDVLQRCRIEYDQDDIKIEWAVYQRKIHTSHWIVPNDSIEYTFKSAERNVFDQMIDPPNELKDVLIMKNGTITDATYSNLVFFNGRYWITPENPLLKGVMRAFLLDKGKIRTGLITADNLSSFQVFKKINALNPFETAPVYFVNKLK